MTQNSTIFLSKVFDKSQIVIFCVSKTIFKDLFGKHAILAQLS